MKRGLWLAGLAVAAVAAGGAVTTVARSQAQPAPAAAPRPSQAVPGYLSAALMPNSLTLLPPPPAAGSSAMARDAESAKAAVALHGGPRWTQATQDAILTFPAAAETFSCAVDAPITETDTPRLYVLLRRVMSDLGRSVYPTKNQYKRARPFTVNGSPQCTPELDGPLRADGSYPSGHSAIGWGWALVLAEAAPDRADAVLARGRAFGQSRVVCNVHWLSDAEEGRVMAAGVVARLHAEEAFRADLAAAKAELAKARAAGQKPTRNCTTEAAQLAAG